MKFSVKSLVTIGILSCLSFIIMLFEIPLPFMPVFLKIDFSDVPALLAAFSIGPLGAVMVELIKNLLHLLLRNETAGIGELANFLVGVAYVIPAALVYKYYKNKKGAVVGLVAGTASMIVFASLFNYYVLLPLYASVLHYPTQAVVAMGTEANTSIVDVNSLIVLAIAPFNAIKGIAVSLVVALIYKKLSPILHKS
jgi:riboflavin transporter